MRAAFPAVPNPTVMAMERGPDSGREHGQHAEEQRDVRRVGLEPDHGVEGDGVDHCRQHPQQQPIKRGCSAQKPSASKHCSKASQG